MFANGSRIWLVAVFEAEFFLSKIISFKEVKTRIYDHPAISYMRFVCPEWAEQYCKVHKFFKLSSG